MSRRISVWCVHFEQDNTITEFYFPSLNQAVSRSCELLSEYDCKVYITKGFLEVFES